MKRLAEIVAAFSDIDGRFERSWNANSDEVFRERLGKRQVLNDQAYFLLCWGQLETEIDERCRFTIRHRRASTDWQVRRGWDIYNPDDRRLSGLSFEERASLVLDRDGGYGSAYATAMRHYVVTNRIAHGKLESARVDVVQAARDFYAVQSAMTRHA